jgi:putative Holliday junction resolvase
MRVLGIDHGQARIGLALSDPMGLLASPFQVLERRRRLKQDLKVIAGIVEEHAVLAIVVGMPFEMSGEAGKKAAEVRQFIRNLKTHVSVPVHEWDERLTTVAADRALDTMKVRGKRRKELVDQMAAAVILQGYLDAQSGPLDHEEWDA